MKVLGEQPQSLLLEEDGVLYLYAFCSHSFFDYIVLIALNDEEIAAYRKGGSDYLARLAYQIHYSAPGAKGNKSPFGPRNLTVLGKGEYDRAHAAVRAWDAAKTTPATD